MVSTLKEGNLITLFRNIGKCNCLFERWVYYLFNNSFYEKNGLFCLTKFLTNT